MTYKQLRDRVRFILNDMEARTYPEEMIKTLINEALRIFCRETLILEGSSSSLSYSSPGFTLPTDLIKVKVVQWVNSNGEEFRVSAEDLSVVLERQAQGVTLAVVATPKNYAIDNGKMILDSTTQTSPEVYYYKYDSALSADGDTPAMDSEYHRALVDYAVYELVKGNPQMIGLANTSYNAWLHSQDLADRTKRKAGNVKVRPRFL